MFLYTTFNLHFLKLMVSWVLKVFDRYINRWVTSWYYSKENSNSLLYLRRLQEKYDVFEFKTFPINHSKLKSVFYKNINYIKYQHAPVLKVHVIFNDVLYTNFDHSVIKWKKFGKSWECLGYFKTFKRFWIFSLFYS